MHKKALNLRYHAIFFLECHLKCKHYSQRYFRPVCSSDGRVFRNNCDFQEYRCFKHGKVSAVSCYKGW